MESNLLKRSFVILILANILNVGIAQDHQLNLKPCSQKDPQVNVCLKETFTTLYEYSKKVLARNPRVNNDQLKIKNIPIDLPNLAVKGNFDDVVLLGVADAFIQAVKSDISKLRFDLKVTIPKFEAKGRYSLIGTVPVLPFNAGGNFWASFSGVTLIVKLYPRRVAKYKNDETYLELNKVNVDFAVKDMKFKIKEQVSKPLEAVYEQVLNEQAPTFAKELKSTISNSFSELFKDIFSDVISTIPEREILEL